MRSRRSCVLVLLVAMATASCGGGTVGGTAATISVGLWDPGFKQAVARSELGDINTVTIGSCLYPGPCPVGVTCSPCPSGPTAYQQSNFFSTVTPPPQTSYWVVDHNNDVGALALSFDACNSGPPDQSLPVGDYSTPTVFNLSIGSGSAGKRAYLGLRNQHNPCATGIPYLGIGTNKHRGNAGKAVGRFVRGQLGTSSDLSTARFSAAMTACNGGPCLFYFNVHARWNNKPRLLVVTLGHINHPGAHLHHAHFNWPVVQSYFYSGYDIAYLRCEDSGVPCLTVSSSGTDYAVSMSELLVMASDLGLFDDEIPVEAEVSIEGVSWAIETTGSRAVVDAWVESMQVTGPDTSPPTMPVRAARDTAAARPPPATATRSAAAAPPRIRPLLVATRPSRILR